MLHQTQDMIQLAFSMTDAVERFRKRARQFFYQVMLSGHACAKCGGQLVMVREGHCRCQACGDELDPTIVFQRCSGCGGMLTLAIRRYCCRQCGADIQSRFLFDGLVFDAEYFRQKMAESRERKWEQRERVRQMLAGSRSGWIDVPPADPRAIPGLVDALNQLSQGSVVNLHPAVMSGFNLKRYQSHVQAHIGSLPVSLRQIPPLSEDARKDLIWRFIAILFLDHAGLIEIWQDGPDIMVMQRETDTEGQGVPQPATAADGIEGHVGRVEA